MRHITLYATIAAALLVSGCMTEDTVRHDGVTGSAGNAVAANTVLQMVDPWPYGVQDTDLEVPAERPEAAEDGDDAAGAAPVTLD